MHASQWHLSESTEDGANLSRGDEPVSFLDVDCCVSEYSTFEPINPTAHLVEECKCLSLFCFAGLCVRVSCGEHEGRERQTIRWRIKIVMLCQFTIKLSISHHPAMDELYAQVQAAVAALYGSNDAERRAADAWLIDFRTSPLAWPLAWLLVSSSPADPSLQYHGASILHYKIATSWHELQPDEQASLKDGLLGAIISAAGSNLMVARKLCVVLAAFALQAIPTLWSSVVPEILNFFQQSAATIGSAAELCALEALAILPEEFESANIDSARQGALEQCLLADKDQISAFLYQVLQQPSDSIPPAAFKCLSSWVSFGLPLESVEPHIQLIVSVLAVSFVSKVAIRKID